MSIKLLIADDEDTIRNGIAKYIQLHTDRFDKIYLAANGQEAVGTEPTEEKNRLVELAREYIEEHYYENLMQVDVAQRVGISAGYLSTLFRSSCRSGLWIISTRSASNMRVHIYGRAI